MASSKYKERLAAMSGSWEQSQGAYDQMFGGVDIPEGVYQARLQGAKILESKSSQKLMIRREHLITEGEYKGMVAWDNMMLETPNGLVYVRRWIEMMGYQCPQAGNFEEIEDVIEAILNESPDVKVRLTRDGDFTNIAVAELLGVSTEGEAEDAVEPEAEAPSSEDSDDVHLDKTCIEYKSFCESEGVDLADVNTAMAEAIFNEICEYTFEFDKLEESSIDFLQQIGLEEKIEGMPEEAEEDDELKNSLVEFCVSQDIEHNDDDDAEMLKERLNGFDYPEDTLTKKEIDLLKEIGQEKNITKAAPKKAPAKAASNKKAPTKKGGASKAPAKKTAGKKAPAKKSPAKK